jgi:hyperosmotically inducible protein
MKGKLCKAALIALSFSILGCTTIASSVGNSAYGLAVDRRKVGTIAEDTKIVITILTKFIDDDVVNAQDISTYCYDGHVYLIGEYESKEQKKRSLQIAKSVDGVKFVSSYLSLKNSNNSCGSFDNLAISAKVRMRLIADKDILSTNVDIKTVNCTAVLLGIVGSEQEIQQIVTHALSVTGINGVKTYLKKAQ